MTVLDWQLIARHIVRDPNVGMSLHDITAGLNSDQVLTTLGGPALSM